MTRAATAAWALLAVIAGAFAMRALFIWAGAVPLRGPVLYGEGAVANAALLLRTGDAYRGAADLPFVAANYPPLYYAIAAVGDPFVTGRVASILATLVVAALIVARASPAGVLVAAAHGLTWLALAPVSIWGAAVKPDLVSLAFTVAGVVLVDARRARPAFAGALLVSAAFTKPTALLPLVAIAVWLALARPAAARRFVAGCLASAVACLAAVAWLGPADVWRHVVVWNALPWSVTTAAELALVGAVTTGLLAVVVLMARAARGAVAAYLAAAVTVMLLGGREGATINYLLDLSAALALALASAAVRLRARPAYAAAAVGQVVLAALVLNPLGLFPDRPPTTGAWGDQARVTAVRALDDDLVLAEDAGLLVASGRRVTVDDLFLWSRLATAGRIEAAPLLAAVRERRFGAVLAEVDLSRLEDAPAYERARWPAELVAAVRAAYPRMTREGPLYVYRP